MQRARDAPKLDTENADDLVTSDAALLQHEVMVLQT